MPTIFCAQRKHFPKQTSVVLPKRIKKSARLCRPPRPKSSRTSKPTIWQDIVDEDREFENYMRKEKEKNLPVFECESSYIKRELFPYLVPAFEKLCLLALKKDVTEREVRFFNFLDLLAEILYNINPAYEDRRGHWLSVHQIYKDPYRPYYPFFWFLTPDEAATLIQSLVRRFLTRCRYDLRLMKEQKRKIDSGIAKQKKCYNALKECIEDIFLEPPMTKPVINSEP